MSIPGPKLKPAVQSFHWYARPLAFLEECAEKYGEPFAIDLSRFGKHVCFSEPKHLRAIFTTYAEQLDAGVGNAPLRALLGDHSLLTMDGDDHRHHRRMLMPAFHGKRIALYASQIQAICDTAAAKWPVGKPFEVFPALQDLTLTVILETVFGFQDEMRKKDLRMLIGNLLHHSNVSLSFFERFEDDAANAAPDATLEWMRQRSSRLDALLYQEIEQRRAFPSLLGEDVLSMMLRTTDDEGNALESVEIHDELLTLLVAGHETTAASLAWTLLYIAANPEVQRRCREAVDAIAPGKSAAVAMAKSEWLRAVCNESLRIMPVIPVVSRGAKEDIVIDGHAIEAGTRVTPCIYLTHRRPEIWPDPTAFQPERFLERSYTPYEFLPFGGGFRRCIGAAMALHQMAITIGIVMRRFELRLEAGELPRPLRSALLIVPARGAQVVLTPR